MNKKEQPEVREALEARELWEFERYAKRKGCSLTRNEDGEYLKRNTKYRWWGWQARATLDGDTHAQMVAENQRLREALTFYATIENWGWSAKADTGYILDFGSDVYRDFGNVARAALQTSGGGNGA